MRRHQARQRPALLDLDLQQVHILAFGSPLLDPIRLTAAPGPLLRRIGRIAKTRGVFTHGGREATELDALEFALLAENNGAGEILLTSMDKDGTKSGYDLQLTKSMTNSLKIPVVASGGVGTLEHIKDGIVKGGASAVLAASIFHFGEFSISQVKEYLNSENVPVRI